MIPGNPWQSYRQVATKTAPPGTLVLMLYDGALRFLNLALGGFDLEDPLEYNMAINNNLLRAQDIINELNLSLNMTGGGEFAHTMRSLYTYFDSRLQESNAYKKPEGIREVVLRLTVLRDAWSEMLAKQGQTSDLPPQEGQPFPSLEARG